MDEKQKTEFDASAKDFLNCKVCQSYYVVTLTQAPDSSGQTVEEGILRWFNLTAHQTLCKMRVWENTI
jgi:hypothetical protein